MQLKARYYLLKEYKENAFYMFGAVCYEKIFL
jgi:hypothetical protein